MINSIEGGLAEFLIVLDRHIIQQSQGATGMALLHTRGELLHVQRDVEPLAIWWVGAEPGIKEEEAPPPLQDQLEKLKEEFRGLMTDQTRAMEDQKAREDAKLNALYAKLAEDQRAHHARQANELKEAGRKGIRASVAYTQGARSDLASQFYNVATQIDNIANNTDLGKANQQAHAASVLLANIAHNADMGNANQQASTSSMLLAGRADGAAADRRAPPAVHWARGCQDNASVEGHTARVLAVPSMTQGARFSDLGQPQGGGWRGGQAGRQGNAANAADNQRRGNRPGGIRPRTPRKDAKGNIIRRYGEKPQTDWEDLDPSCQAPFLAGYGFTAANWEEKAKEPCGICSQEGEVDHDWGHCIYVWSCSGAGRKYLGEAKAADKMAALFGSSTLVVRELLAANPTVSESLVAVMLAVDVDEDEPIDSLLALVFEASNFAERVHNCGSD
jgi:hypothetical protein